MSVELLTNPNKCVEVSDDLESFFLVLLYYAIRYLDSNIEDVGDYIEEFFDTVTLKGGMYTVGHAKCEVMKQDVGLTTMAGADSKKLAFNSPLDGLFHTLLRSFQAAYKIREYKRRATVDPLSSDVTEKIPPQTPVKTTSIPSGPRRRRAQFASRTVVVPTKIPERPLSVPTKEDRDLADNVEDHELMVEILGETLDMPWPTVEVHDRIPTDHESIYQYDPTVTPLDEPKARLKRLRVSKSFTASTQSQIEGRRRKSKRGKVSEDDAESSTRGDRRDELVCGC